MRTLTVRHLSPQQQEDWEFRLYPHDSGGGTVALPSIQNGYPIDWPPRYPAQAEWLHTVAPHKEARAGAAWYVKPRVWKQLLEKLESQVELEQAM